MGDLGSAIVGGLIVAITSEVRAFVADRRDRRNKQSDVEREALIAWVSAFEQWVSLYDDYSGLVLGKPESPDQTWTNVYLERMKEAGEAGRRLDVAKNCVLVVERFGCVRDEVIRLTMKSEVRFHTQSGDPRAQATAFRDATESLRNDLRAFLDRYAKRQAPD